MLLRALVSGRSGPARCIRLDYPPRPIYAPPFNAPRRCCCVLHGRVHSQVHSGHWFPPCCVFFLLSVVMPMSLFLPCGCWAAAPNRQRLRQKYALPGEPWHDWLLHVLPCTW